MPLFVDLFYDKLVSLIVGSHYVTFYDKNIATSVPQDIAMTSKDLGKKNMLTDVNLKLIYFDYQLRMQKLGRVMSKLNIRHLISLRESLWVVHPTFFFGVMNKRILLEE